MPNEEYATFEDVKARLDQIVDAVGDDSLPLDDALALYEEAVGLGLRASDLLEEGIEARREAEEARVAESDEAPADAAPDEVPAPPQADGAATA